MTAVCNVTGEAGARRIICSLQRVTPYSAMRSGNNVVVSSPGQTMIASASVTFFAVTTRPLTTSRTASPKRNVTPWRSARKAESCPIAVLDSTRISCGL